MKHDASRLNMANSTDEKSKFEGTKIDLGEDLLEPTRVLQKPAPKPAEDDLQHGEILMNEGLLDDAKKVFRKILRQDPSHVAARDYLDQIQKLEIQDLLGSESSRKRLGQNELNLEDSPAAVMARLEKDLHISFEKAEIKPVPDLFKSEELFKRYREDITEAMVAIAPRDRIDMGVAHLEMGLFEVAQSVFESVVRYEDFKVEGMYLLGLSLIYGGKAIEATIRLEPFARDLTLSESQKTDFLYLMGLAFEKLNDLRKAREFYRRVHMLNPKYRDVLEKLK